MFIRRNKYKMLVETKNHFAEKSTELAFSLIAVRKERNELLQELAEAEAAFDMARGKLKDGLNSLDKQTSGSEYTWPPKAHLTD